MHIVMSLVGMAVLLGIAVLLSTNRKAINLRTVGGAFGIQALFGAFVLYSDVGQNTLGAIAKAFNSVMGYANEGINFVFGGLTGNFVFAINVLSVIIFFASLVSVLYYLGIMQIIIKVIGGGLQKVLGTSQTESLSAAANIFVGQTEAPLLVRPFLARMTQSELFAVMCGGLASVAGAVMFGYAQMGIELKYLIAASFMAAPGGLLMAKIMVPETENSKNDPIDISKISNEDKPANVIDAAASGAYSGMKLAVTVGAMLIAFVSLITMGNGIVSWFGGLLGHPEWTLELLIGYVFSPLALLIGVPWSEAVAAGSLLGQKLVMNEFVAYASLSEYLDVAKAAAAGVTALSSHTVVIITFALCGFANLSSIAILLGGLGSLAPERRKDIARFGLRAVAAGTLSNLMSATMAGLFVVL